MWNSLWADTKIAKRKVFPRKSETIRRGKIAKLGLAAPLKAPGTALAALRGNLIKCIHTSPRLSSPAPEILDYLVRQPEAQDTIDGILQWWVLDSCIRTWAPKITKTVAKLVEQGFLEKKPSPDGQTFYRVSPRYLSTLQQQPTPSSTATETE